MNSNWGPFGGHCFGYLCLPTILEGIAKSADPLPPVPASCRGDRRGMQLEVIGINDSRWKTRPNPQKVDSQDRSGTSGTSPGTSPGTGPGTGFRLLVVSQNRSWDRTGPWDESWTGPGTGPGGPVPGKGFGPDQSWDR